MSRTKMRRKAKTPTAARRNPPGSLPGVLSADPAAQETRIHLIGYSPDDAEERFPASIDDVQEFRRFWPIVWVRVEGLGGIEQIRRIGEEFCLHPLALEDVVNVHQRPKIDAFVDYLFIVARTPSDWRTEVADLSPGTEQVSCFLGKGFVVSFHEHHCPMVDEVRRRILQSVGRLRKMPSDYLLYSLLDASTDAYFPVLEQIGREIDALEDEILEVTAPLSVSKIHDVKRHLVTLRRAVWPQREAINALIRDESEHVTDETRVYFRDLQDHSFQVVELIETYRELAADLTDLYMSTVSNRMNEVMKVLTVIATIFIPLTFIVGVYGMNFDSEVSPWNLPETKAYYGYPICLTVMAAMAIGLLVLFRRKGWIGRQELPRRRDGDPANAGC